MAVVRFPYPLADLSQAGTLSIVMADMLVSMAVIVVISGVARNLVLLERKSSRDRDSGWLPEGNLGDQWELLAGLSGNYQWRLLVTRTSPWPIYEVWHVEKGREWEWIYNTQRAKDTNSRKTRGCMVSGAKMSENHPHWCSIQFYRGCWLTALTCFPLLSTE